MIRGDASGLIAVLMIVLLVASCPHLLKNSAEVGTTEKDGTIYTKDEDIDSAASWIFVIIVGCVFLIPIFYNGKSADEDGNVIYEDSRNFKQGFGVFGWIIILVVIIALATAWMNQGKEAIDATKDFYHQEF